MPSRDVVSCAYVTFANAVLADGSRPVSWQHAVGMCPVVCSGGAIAQPKADRKYTGRSL